MKRSTLLVDDIAEACNAIRESIENTVPVDSGTLQGSFTDETSIGSAGVVGRVSTDDWKAVIIEYGTADHEFSAPIRRGIEAAGYQLSDNGEGDE